MVSQPVSLGRALSPFLVAVGLLASPFAPASTPLVPFPVFNTGVGPNGALLEGATVDPHYTIVSSPDPAYPGPDAIATSGIAEGYWTPNGPNSRWIAPTANQEFPDPDICNASGKYTYRTTFDLTGFDPVTAVIEGNWMTDNWGTDILINGVATGQLSGSYNMFTHFSLTTGFVAGANTIDFVVSDTGCPTGIRVEISKAQAAQAIDPATITAIAAGGYHTCALTSGGGVKCWGYNSQGQLGDNSNTNHPSPVDVPGLASGVAAIATGSYYTCALTATGGVKCWGDNSFGQLGDGSFGNLRLAPIDVPGLASGVSAIAAGDNHTCALMTSGGVKCWGNNFEGEVGDGSSMNLRLTPVDVLGLASGIAAITAGAGHNCALTNGGGVKCWGRNVSGEVGDNSTTDRLTPVGVPGLASGVTAIAAGALHTCALTTGGAVMCWGNNETGQLGDNSTTERHAPVPVPGLAGGVVAIAAGGFNTCALTTGGGVKCWGENLDGELGDNSTTRRYTPVDVSGLASGVTSISVGGKHTCALTANGAVKCWGYNAVGQLGDNTLVNRLMPTAVTGFPGTDTAPDPFSFPSVADAAFAVSQFSSPVVPTGFTSPATITIANGEYSIDCTVTFTTAAAMIAPGQSVCVRHVSSGAYGTSVTTTLTIGGVAGTFTSTTQAAPPLTVSVASLAFGNQLVGTTSPGLPVTLTNPGFGFVGGLAWTIPGDYSQSSATCTATLAPLASCTITVVFTPTVAGLRYSLMQFNSAGTPPVDLTGTGDPVLIAQTIVFGVLLDRPVSSSFTVHATASSGLGVSFSSLTPTVCIALGGATPIVATISTGTCTVAADQAGGGGFSAAPQVTQSFLVEASTNPTDLVAISSGEFHTCALTAGGGVKCWGDNAFSQLGDNSGMARSIVPADVVGLASSATAVAAGGYHSCAITAGGGVKCWGRNDLGQLGDNQASGTGSPVPVNVVGLASGVTAISAGEVHTCALTASDGVKCWGFNAYGQLGDNLASGAMSRVPVNVVGLASGVSIAAGSSHTCAVTAGGGVKCWGGNGAGQLGDNQASGQSGSPVPVNVVGLASGVATISAAFVHTCAVTTGGGVKCWGGNDVGQLGDNQASGTSQSPVPVDVASLSGGVSAITTAISHTCALTTDGGVKCWGRNDLGQLGDNQASGTFRSLVPVNVLGMASGAAVISAGGYHTCALTTDGGGKCWGYNYYGELGDNSTEYRHAPVVVFGLNGMDVTPDPFTFPSRNNVILFAAVVSDAITPTGYVAPSAISVANGEYSIGCTATFTTAAGTINPGQSVCVRHVPPPNYSTSFTTTLTIGGVPGTFTSTTGSAPALSLSTTSANFGNQPVGTTSAEIAITLTNGGSHPAFGMIWGVVGDFTVASTTCAATLAGNSSCTLSVIFTPLSVGGRVVELMVRSTNGIPSALQVLLTGTGTFSDVTPNAFSFVDQFLVATNTVVTSAPVQITGLSFAANVSVIGGTYAVSSGNHCAGDVHGFTPNPGTISDGQYVCVRHTTSAVPGGSNDTQLIVGGLGDTFTTVTKDTVPTAFALGSQSNVALSTIRTSAAVAIAGINAPTPFTVTGGEISVNCTGTFASSGSVAPGSSICARHMTGATFNVTTTTSVTVGGVSGTFTTTTFDANGDADNDGIPNGVEYNEGRNPEAKDNDVFASNRLFAMQQYRDFLGREADAGGLQFYTDLLTNGPAVRANVIESFFNSPEFQGIGSPVARLYFATFLRIPDYDGLLFQMNAFRSGTPLPVIANNFTLSPEFTQRYGAVGNGQYVTLLYQNILGRTPSQGEIDYHVNRLVTGATRGEVLAGFSESPEFQANTAHDVYVTMMYVGMLHRAPEQAGLDYWVNYMDAGNPGINLILGFLNAPEYRSRFLP